jgi:tyrosyl-tRNA synthetase
MALLEELKWRGLYQDSIPGTEDYLKDGVAIGYVGFDPTADSLHIGNLVPVMLLVHLQRHGHKPIALVGGATGMVGDPSGKSSERKLLDTETLQHNLESQKKQLMRFLDFNCGERSAEIVNNYDWFKGISFLDFIRDVGKHITINYMMSKDSVQNRMETGMSFTEFSYQLVQGYDFAYLYENKNCKLQMGGSDQWGNITTGTELIRRKLQGEAFAITAPLLMRSDGKKFGKSEGGNVWLDKNQTSPYKFYQYWLNVSDEDASRFLKIFTLLSKEEIESLEQKHLQDPGFRIMQKTLAENLTRLVHSEDDLQTALSASEILFGKSTQEDLLKLSESAFLEIFEGVPQGNISSDALSSGLGIVEVLTSSGFLTSNGEARRALQENSISINKLKAEGSKIVNSSDLLNSKYLLLQRGKKNYFVVSIV